MKKIENLDFNYKKLVIEGYDTCAEKYMEARKNGSIFFLGLNLYSDRCILYLC